jgi:hypothetical protein
VRAIIAFSPIYRHAIGESGRGALQLRRTGLDFNIKTQGEILEKGRPFGKQRRKSFMSLTAASPFAPKFKPKEPGSGLRRIVLEVPPSLLVIIERC